MGCAHVGCFVGGCGLGFGVGLLFWIYYFSLLDVLSVGILDNVVEEVHLCLDLLSPYCAKPCSAPLLRCLQKRQSEL